MTVRYGWYYYPYMLTNTTDLAALKHLYAAVTRGECAPTADHRAWAQRLVATFGAAAVLAMSTAQAQASWDDYRDDNNLF